MLRRESEPFKLGYFDDQVREYVITTPMTPQPWINYVGNEDFFSLVSNTCGGYSFYKDAKLLRLTHYRYNNVPADTNGRYYFIRHGYTVWTPGWQPVKTALDSYACHHGLGYNRFLASKNRIQAELTEFTVDRSFRDCRYHIHVTNPDGVEKGVRSVWMDGRELEAGDPLPVHPGAVCMVEVIMG